MKHHLSTTIQHLCSVLYLLSLLILSGSNTCVTSCLCCINLHSSTGYGTDIKIPMFGVSPRRYIQKRNIDEKLLGYVQSRSCPLNLTQRNADWEVICDLSIMRGTERLWVCCVLLMRIIAFWIDWNAWFSLRNLLKLFFFKHLLEWKCKREPLHGEETERGRYWSFLWQCYCSKRVFEVKLRVRSSPYSGPPRTDYQESFMTQRKMIFNISRLRNMRKI